MDIDNVNSIKQFTFFGENAEFDHIGIAVRSIDKNVKAVDIIADPIQKVRVAFIKINDVKFELVEPCAIDSPINQYLNNRQSFYHICFRVQNIDSAIKVARTNGFHCIAKPVPAAAFHNRRIAWLFSRTYGLVELLENK